MADQGRVGQEGSRWYNEPPSGKDLAKWFKDAVPLHDGMKHEDYVAGITLIPGTEKAKEVVGWQDGQPVIAKRENLVFTPYPKVETRVKYFHDLMATKKDEWIGFIDPITPPGADNRLPPGFFLYFIATTEGKGTRYVCCTMKVTVFEREGFEEKLVAKDTRRGIQEVIRVGKKVIDAPPATKMIATTTSGWGERQGERAIVADDFALMKAETGAVGRALGMAGMLVIPGAGVATAEDMAEVDRAPSDPVPAEEKEAQVALPTDRPEPSGDELKALRSEVAAAISDLKNEYPDAFKLFQGWAADRGIGRLDAVEDPVKLRGLASKAKRDFEEAKEAAES